MKHSPESGLVDDVGQFRAGCAGGHPGDGVIIHIVRDFDFSGVYLENLLAALQVRKFHRNAPVKTAWPGQRGIQGFRTVGGGENNHAGVPLETVHLGQQLI